MPNLFDELQMGTISRRRLFELLPVAGASALAVRAQTAGDQPKMSPANIGGGGQPNKVEWAEGSLFAVPVNVEHRHYNTDSAHPARLLYITSFPFMLQVFGSMGLINDLNFNFNDRYDGAPDYFTSTKRVRKR